MGRGPEQTFFQRRHTDGQQAHEKMFNIINYQRYANQNHNETSPHTIQNDHHLKSLKMLERVWRRESSPTVWGECKLVQPLW